MLMVSEEQYNMSRLSACHTSAGMPIFNTSI